MGYTFAENQSGLLQIANIDTGVTSPSGVSSGSSSVIPTPPNVLGKIVRADDPTFGEGEFIMLVGVASTVVGSLVSYNATTYQTTLVPNTAVQACPVAVAMSANLAGTFGWYQIAGNAVIKKTAVAVTPQVTVFLSATAGRIKVVASAGLQVVAARSANLTTIAATVSTVTVTINRPHLQSQIT
jgi:hypothetical protein